MHDDAIQPSIHNRDIHMVRKAAQEAPEVRQNRVAAAKKALQQDKLMLDADILADRLLADPLLRDEEL